MGLWFKNGNAGILKLHGFLVFSILRIPKSLRTIGVPPYKIIE
jgi:hypothetical protein